MRQYAVIFCAMWQCAALGYNMQHDAAIYCAMLQYVAICSATLQYAARCCNTSSSTFDTSKSIRSVEAERLPHFLKFWQVCVLSRQNVRLTFWDFEKYAFCRGRTSASVFQNLKSMRSVEAECPDRFFQSPARLGGTSILFVFEQQLHENSRAGP